MKPGKANSENRKHLLIGGTGRSGTTLLVQLFTHLGYDTGYTKSESRQRVDRISRAGLEHSLFHGGLPHVVKSPWFSDEISDALEYGLPVEAAIVPIRNLFDAAESRREVYRQAAAEGLDPLAHPGSLWKVRNPSDQEQLLATQLYRFLEPLVAHQVPIHFVGFPRFVDDPDYFYSQLKPIFDTHGTTRDEAIASHREVVDARLIHRSWTSAEVRSER